MGTQKVFQIWLQAGACCTDMVEIAPDCRQAGRIRSDGVVRPTDIGGCGTAGARHNDAVTMCWHEPGRCIAP
jgi:hypothetical protein